MGKASRANRANRANPPAAADTPIEAEKKAATDKARAMAKAKAAEADPSWSKEEAEGWIKFVGRHPDDDVTLVKPTWIGAYRKAKAKIEQDRAKVEKPAVEKQKTTRAQRVAAMKAANADARAQQAAAKKVK